MAAMNIALLKTLSEVTGVPGREERVREIVRLELKGLVDEIREDALGNLIALKRATVKAKKSSSVRKVMLSAHMDEIGFMVKFIDDKGFLRVQQLGGFDARNLFARQVVVCSKDGDLPGILQPSGRPIHISSAEERGKNPEIKQFFVDTGLSAIEVKKKVRIGDPVGLTQTFREVGAYVAGKCLDDRIWVFVLLETLKALKGKQHQDDIYAVFSVQEEIGLRGAVVAAYGIEPDIGIGLDTTLAVDIPGVEKDESVTVTGNGVGIKVFDSSMVATHWLVEEFAGLADQKKIKYQLEVLPLGGTDAGAIQRSRAGVASITLSLPSRYVHTVQETVHKDDLSAALKLLTAWLIQ
jgi:putative aminopeptidase FrvX